MKIIESTKIKENSWIIYFDNVRKIDNFKRIDSLKEIIKNRKQESAVRDIIETIQEKQYEIITKPEKSNFVLQGCAGSGANSFRRAGKDRLQ